MATENMIRPAARKYNDDDDGRYDNDDGNKDDNDSPSPSTSTSCPIRSSIRSSVMARRQSSIMTVLESEFVHEMLNNSSLDIHELKSMDTTLKCDQLFFDPNRNNNKQGAGSEIATEVTTSSTTQQKEEEEEVMPQKGSSSNLHRNSSPDLVALAVSSSKNNNNKKNDEPAVTIISNGNSNPDLAALSSVDNLLSNTNAGSTKRQEYLALRKKQSQEQCKRRAKLMWKQVKAGLKMASLVQRLSVSGKNENMTLVEEGEEEEEEEEEEKEAEAAAEGDEQEIKRTTTTSSTGDDDDDVDDVDDDVDHSRTTHHNTVSGNGACPTTTTTTTTNRRDVFLRQASVNVYGGEGFEIGAEMFAPKPSSYDDDDDDDDDDKFLEEKKSGDSNDNHNHNNNADADDDTTSLDDDDEEQIRSFSSLPMFSGTGAGAGGSGNQQKEGFRRASMNIYGGDGFEVANEMLFDSVYTEEGEHHQEEEYDPWLYAETDAHGRRYEFKILGTAHDDVECHPHVLSPIHMDRFQPHLPNSIRGESFWLKYSLVRDGASSLSLLQQVRGSPYTLFAMETVDGEVFGGFFATAWTVQGEEYFGRGESFLWKMKHRRGSAGSNIHDSSTSSTSHTNLDDSFSSRDSLSSSLSEQVDREAELVIYKAEAYYGNHFYQMCTHDKLAAGGGACDFPKDFGNGRGTYPPHDIGFGLFFDEGSMMEGSSSACLTYRSPPLSDLHPDGSQFEVVNLEVWGFTPCRTEKEARTLEYKNMFFQQHARATKK